MNEINDYNIVLTKRNTTLIYINITLIKVNSKNVKKS